MTTLQIGPAQGTLTLHTGVEGRAARIGHALTIELTDWSAVVTLTGTEPTALLLTVPFASLRVLKGDGVLPLTPLDKRTIRSSALKALRADEHPELRFTSTSVRSRAGGYDVQGDVALAGATGSLGVTVAVLREEGQVRCEASFPFVQTDFGVKPYAAMRGALRVSDAVQVRLTATFPDPLVA